MASPDIGAVRTRRLPIAAWTAFVTLFGVVPGYLYVRYFADANRLNPNYPATNPRPAHVVELRVSIPSTLKVQLFADYQTFHPDCWHWINFPLGYTDLNLAERVELHGAGEQKTGSVTVDKYLPGKCNWYLSDIRYFLPEGVRFPNQLRHGHFATSVTHLRDTDPGMLRQRRVDLWCTQHIAFVPPGQLPECTTWAIAVGAPSQSHALGAADIAPDSDKGDVPFTYILSSTRIVEVHFHDLDAK
jgi:hypothetical protein